MVGGLVGENHLAEIQTCATDAESLVPQVEELIADIEAKHLIKAAKLAKTIAGSFPTMLSACEGMGPEVKALAQWATVFEHPKTIAEDIAKSMVFHKKEITGDISTVKTDWNAKQYYQSGMAAADILFVSVGPVPQSSNNVGMDLFALPEVAAGFVYGMVGDNHLSEMEACYSSTQPLIANLETALKDIEAFHIVSALKELESFVYHVAVDAAPCMKMGDDVAAIEKWAQIFKSKTTLVATATKHYLMHKKAITADIATVKADWAASSFFATGKAAADLITILVGPIEE